MNSSVGFLPWTAISSVAGGVVSSGSVGGGRLGAVSVTRGMVDGGSVVGGAVSAGLVSGGAVSAGFVSGGVVVGGSVAGGCVSTDAALGSVTMVVSVGTVVGMVVSFGSVGASVAWVIVVSVISLTNIGGFPALHPDSVTIRIKILHSHLSFVANLIDFSSSVAKAALKQISLSQSRFASYLLVFDVFSCAVPP